MSSKIGRWANVQTFRATILLFQMPLMHLDELTSAFSNDLEIAADFVEVSSPYGNSSTTVRHWLLPFPNISQ